MRDGLSRVCVMVSTRLFHFLLLNYYYKAKVYICLQELQRR